MREASTSKQFSVSKLRKMGKRRTENRKKIRKNRRTYGLPAAPEEKKK